MAQWVVKDSSSHAAWLHTAPFIQEVSFAETDRRLCRPVTILAVPPSASNVFIEMFTRPVNTLAARKTNSIFLLGAPSNLGISPGPSTSTRMHTKSTDKLCAIIQNMYAALQARRETGSTIRSRKAHVNHRTALMVHRLINQTSRDRLLLSFVFVWATLCRHSQWSIIGFCATKMGGMQSSRQISSSKASPTLLTASPTICIN